MGWPLGSAVAQELAISSRPDDVAGVIRDMGPKRWTNSGRPFWRNKRRRPLLVRLRKMIHVLQQARVLSNSGQSYVASPYGCRNDWKYSVSRLVRRIFIIAIVLANEFQNS